ncbi:P-loop containing nucleoside triphosphate hydrolase protein [Mycena belliarum]|uniref:P-loop containing nucleoside triphosphate hydrolase protein n=1 Tax=Mycena belliarum TaxID=1033014 RepID=A0AAD6U2Q3_9AGAR|nr:P-loop containing nucleoside triphosphate hydrolase protein [Mycena belliae]
MYDRERLGKSTLLAYDMGLGKTVTASALVCSNRTPAFTDFPTTLVIAPSIGILQHWQGELTKFAPKLRVVLYHKDGRKHDPRLPDIALLTLSELRNQYAAYIDENTTDSEKYPLYSGTFHRVIIDEAHTIRNPESASAKACWALKKSHGLCLTGTPAQNKLMDLHSLLKFLEVASEGLNDLTTFNARVTAPYEGGDFERPMELIVRVLSECMIYRPKNPRLVRLPKLHASVVVAVELTPAEREVYLYMKSDHRFKSQWAKTVRLRQAADHPMLLTTALHRGDIGPKPDDTSDQMRAALDESRADANKTIAQDSPLPIGKLPPSLQKHAAIFKPGYLSSKFIALLGILERIPDGQKVIIFSHFLTNLDLLAEILPRASYARYDGRMGPSERVAALDQIRNEKKCTILLLSIMAGGTGLDIPACNHVVLMEPWWNPYVEEQAISRVHRIGQSRDVRVYRLLVKDSIEDSIVKTQDAKKEIIGGLLSLCEVPDVDEMKKWLA